MDLNDPNSTPSGESSTEQTISTAELLFGGPPSTETPDVSASEANLDQPTVIPPTVVEKKDVVPAVTQGTASQVAPVATPDAVVPILAITDIVPPVVQVPAVPAVVPPVQVQPVAPVVQTPAVVTPAATPSVEDIHKSLNVYKMNDADYAAIFETESKADSIKALDNVLQKVARQAVTMAHTLAEERIAALTSQVQPYMQFADEQRMSVMEQNFYQTNPDLKGSEPLVEAVVNAFAQKKVKFNTPQEMFTAIATNVKAYKQQLGGQTQVPKAPAPVQPPAAKPRMAPLSSGGQGGAAPSGGSASGMSTARALFGG